MFLPRAAMRTRVRFPAGRQPGWRQVDERGWGLAFAGGARQAAASSVTTGSMMVSRISRQTSALQPM
jgi:hypothetical protein